MRTCRESSSLKVLGIGGIIYLRRQGGGVKVTKQLKSLRADGPRILIHHSSFKVDGMIHLRRQDGGVKFAMHLKHFRICSICAANAAEPSLPRTSRAYKRTRRLHQNCRVKPANPLKLANPLSGSLLLLYVALFLLYVGLWLVSFVSCLLYA